MSSFYAMQRANGDWFAIEDQQSLRVPVFSSNGDASQARLYNVEMLVFKPVLLAEHTLKDLAPLDGDRPTYFWLVNKAMTNLRKGVALTYAQLAERVRRTIAEESEAEPA
jgi:hypothetical protein